jgi:hypothetical protein
MKKSLLFLALIGSISVKAQTSDNEIVNVDKKRMLAEYEIVVSPNPSSGAISINAPFGAQCKVVSSKGTYVGTWGVQDDGFFLDGLSEGTYIVAVTFEGQTITRKFLVL